MRLIKLMKNIAIGATAAVAAVTVLPIAGAVGTITATGIVVASVAGGVAGAIDHVNDEKKHNDNQTIL